GIFRHGGDVLVVERVRRAAQAGATRVAAAQRPFLSDLVALGVVVEVLAGEVGEARRGARGGGDVEFDGDRATVVGGDRHRAGADGGQVLARRLAHVLQAGVGGRVLVVPEADVGVGDRLRLLVEAAERPNRA